MKYKRFGEDIVARLEVGEEVVSSVAEIAEREGVTFASIQGIGAGFIPSVLNTEVIDEIIAVSDEDAYICGAEIGRREGILTGPSGGAALFAAKNIIQRKEFRGKTIVVLLPDGGIKYLSSPLFRKFFTEQRQ